MPQRAVPGVRRQRKTLVSGIVSLFWLHRDGLLLRFRRGPATIGLWQPEAVIQAGDMLLVVSPEQGAAATDAARRS